MKKYWFVLEKMFFIINPKILIQLLKEKRYFLCKDKKILSQQPFSEYQRTYTDALEIYRLKTKSEYKVYIYNTDRKIFRSIKPQN